MSKRKVAWLIAAMVVILLCVSVARSLQARRAVSEAAAAPRAEQGYDLSASDVVAASTQELISTLPVSGGLKAVNSTFIKAKVSAEVKSLLVREGDTVKAGQVLGQLDTSELTLRVNQATQTAESSRAQLAIAQRALENNRALVAQGFISPTGLQTSISNEAAARATFGAAQAAVELARKSLADARLVAPISGTVSQRLVQVGERVSVETRLLEVVDLSRLELEAAMPPEDVIHVRVGQVALLNIDGLAEVIPAKVARINPSTQAGTRAVMVYLSLASQPGLRQGLFAKGSIELQRRSTLVVPVSSVRVDQASPYVLAIVDGKVATLPVRLGARGDVLQGDTREPMVEIREGLNAGATLLRGSVGLLRAGTPVKLAAAASAATH